MPVKKKILPLKNDAGRIRNEQLIEHYENLRTHMISGDKDLLYRNGLSLLINEGVKAWMKACTEVCPEVNKYKSSDRPKEIHVGAPSGLRGELVQILSSVVLKHFQEGLAC